MPGRSILTPAELAFLQQLHEQAEPAAKPAAQDLLVNADKQFSDLLTYCAAHAQLSLHAHVANQCLTFDLQLNQDPHSAALLQLGMPQIFDEGLVNRAWRSPLPQPVPLRQRNTHASGLWIHQLSINGALVEYRAARQAPAHFHLLLALDEYPIALTGELVRKTPDGLLAYRLHPLEPEADEQLRQFIYRQHLQAWPPRNQPLALGQR